MRARVRAGWDLKRMGTALTWAEDFVCDTDRRLFLPLAFVGELAPSVYNQQTLDYIAEYMVRRGSIQRGRLGAALASDTIATVVGQVALMAADGFHYRVTVPEVNTVMARSMKALRREAGPPGARRECQGLRAQHFRLVVDRVTWDRTSGYGQLRWATIIVAHNALLRGGEPGAVEGRDFDPYRGITIGSVELRDPCADSDWCEWLVLLVVAIKDFRARHRAVPMLIRRRQPLSRTAFASDPLCAYDAVVGQLRRRQAAVPAERWGEEPLFARADGVAIDTADVRAFAEELAAEVRLAGVEIGRVGAKSLRVGGATDMRDIFGDEYAPQLIRERGRWASDVALIYQRALAHAHLSGSARVGDASGLDLESLCAGWVQPATFR
tara:strand:- start:232 stop:1377 length:1146 start_codon:yes stop_codon:yes gene_type:complete